MRNARRKAVLTVRRARELLMLREVLTGRELLRFRDAHEAELREAERLLAREAGPGPHILHVQDF
jgi:hypothetical protein